MKSPDTDARKILLIGDIGKAFADTDAVRELPCEVHTHVLDALRAAAKSSFKAIAVVMSDLSSNIDYVLKTLRQTNAGAKILLLVQMHEEPLAMQLVHSASDSVNVADDYLICPMEVARFCEAIMPLVGRRVVAKTAPVAVDMSTEMKMKKLEKLATTDDLTGLKNRRYIWEFSRQIIEYARKEGGRVTLLLFDIDNLKSYNDAYGHLAGDEILKQVGVLMRRCCRQHDVVGRIGGDEFAVVFWDGPKARSITSETERRSRMAAHPKEAISIAKRFLDELKKAEFHLLGPEGKGVLTISGGLASFPEDGSAIQGLFRQADRALLEAKRSGKNKIYLVGKRESDIADIE